MASRYALISVYDKSGVVPFAQQLCDAGFIILSTGGTARILSEGGITVTPVSEYTGAPEMMDGRVKTLHPRVHGGILGNRDLHADEAAAHDIPWIDVVAVNLYPFEQVTQKQVDLATAVENIDIGGPTMVRAAAKNHRHVVVVTDPADYPAVGEALKSGLVTSELRTELALKAFRHTARYDSVISAWIAENAGLQGFEDERTVGMTKVQGLRYGENPHQKAAFYADSRQKGRSLARCRQHQGVELSFNNLGDLDGALRLVFEFPRPACAIIKHMNPAGCATGETLVGAFERALAGDPVSAYGGIVVFNRPVGPAEVKAIRSSRTYFEILAAPGYTEDALERIKSREKLRVLELPADWADERPVGMDARRVQGGWLFQDWDLLSDVELKVVTKRAPTPEEVRALEFAWAACRNVKSNAIVLAKADEGYAFLNGVGGGQMSRVDSVRIALMKATQDVAGSVLASDAFFPFPDGVQTAAVAGVTAIIQPGGSIRDGEVIAAADEAGVAMVFTGHRHFRH